MLRRKILTSAMASVMALTSVSVVAFADDTATDVKNVKTKADLEAYVKSFDSFRNKEINEVGSISGERALSTLEYADNVLEDNSATPDDYTVAYKMVEEAMKRCVLHTSSELRDLINTCEKAYVSDNILNEDLGDAIYDEDVFAAFASAFESAEGYINSNDSRLITDAYEELEEAWSALNSAVKPTVTKAQFRTALKNFEKIISAASQYDSWRRGAVGGWKDIATGNYWVFDGRVVSFGELLDILTVTGVISMDNDGWAASVLIENTGDINWGVGGTIANGSTIEEIINDAYNALDDEKAVTKTSLDEYVKAYQNAVDAYVIFGEWQADDTNRATKASVTTLLNNYHAQLVRDYRTTAAESLYEAATGNEAPAEWSDLTNDTSASVSIKVEDGYAQFDENEEYTAAGAKTQSVGRKQSFLKYVDFDSSYVTSNDVLKNAIWVAEQYINGVADSSDVYGLDETGAVSKPTASGSTVEWTLVYRYLKYALEDAYPATSNDTYTKAEVSALVEKAYDLADLTGDSPVFATEHQALVTARQFALTWVREANKNKAYKHGDVVEVEGIGYTSTEAYNVLNYAYTQLEKIYADYKYSYEEIYLTIADVCDKIDSGELEATDKLVNNLNDTAYNLAILEADKVADDDNEAFTSDRFFNAHNRLHTDKNSSANLTGYESKLLATYEALLAEVNAQLNPAGVLGDVNGDGVVNTLDAALILKATVDGTVDTLSNADFNADGVVNSLDAASILKAVVDGTV